MERLQREWSLLLSRRLVSWLIRVRVAVGVIEKGCFVLKKGADPPAFTISAPLGVWGAVGVSSRGSRKSTCVVGGVRAGLAMGAGWGARWGVGARSQRNGMNGLGVYSGVGGAGSTLGVLEIWVCAG